MELVRCNPRRELFSLNKLFDDFFYPAANSNPRNSTWNWNPVVDIYDNEKNIVIKAEIPGIDKDDIIIDVKGRVLTLKGERTESNEVKEDKYYRRERSFGTFERVFNLPADVNTENIKATYKDGVLELEIPKPEVEQPKQIAVH